MLNPPAMTLANPRTLMTAPGKPPADRAGNRKGRNAAIDSAEHCIADVSVGAIYREPALGGIYFADPGVFAGSRVRRVVRRERVSAFIHHMVAP